MIELRTIQEGNYEQCFRLKASVEKDDFVDPVIDSLAEAWVLLSGYPALRHLS